MPNRTLTRGPLIRAARIVRPLVRRGRTEADWLRSRRERADVAVFNDFEPPPYGGGNQFLLAFVGELQRRGLDVELNRLSGATPACLFNSFTFDLVRLRRFARDGVRMVHRVDGPIAVYRGFDDGTDRRIIRINDELADATVFQSRWSLDRHHEPRRVELTFVGNTRCTFERIRVVAPRPSQQVAELLRAHDAYLAPSRDDPCSNALLEALACGLPAAFLRSGGHPELVREGGIAFDEAEQLPAVIDRLRDELEVRRAAIRIPVLADVADRYLEALRG